MEKSSSGPQNDGKNLDVAYSSSTTTKVETKTSKEGATFGEYPATQSVGLKSTVNQSVENKPKLNESTGYNSVEGEYTSTSAKIENKDSKEGATFAEYTSTQSTGLKSTVNKPEENKDMKSSVGYNSMEGEYTSTTAKPENKDSKEGATSENKPKLTESTGYNSVEGEYTSTSVKVETKTSKESIENKPKLNESCGYNSVEGEYTSKKSNIENKDSKEGATFGEYPATQSVGLKSTVNQPNLTTSTGYNSTEGAYISTSVKLENKDSKEGATFGEYPATQSVGIKSTISQPVGNQPNLTASTGYNSMEGAYISTSVKLENKDSKEGATFGEYPATQSVGLKSTINQSVGNQPNLSASTGYNSQTGAYISPNTIPVTTSINLTQPVIPPLIVQVPGNPPIINTNIPLGNVQTTITKTTVTTTTTYGPGNPVQTPIVTQTIPLGQPLAGSTFAEYPMTTSINGPK